jgi:hypothetical protein
VPLRPCCVISCVRRKRNKPSAPSPVTSIAPINLIIHPVPGTSVSAATPIGAAFPYVREVRWYGPLSHAAGETLNLQRCGEVMEFRVGERIVASVMTSPLGGSDDDATS